MSQSEALEITDEEGAYPDLFGAHLLRALKITLDGWFHASPPWDDTLCARTLHLLTYALRAPSQWSLTRAVLLAAATPLRLKGYRHEWMAVLAQALPLAAAHRDHAAAAQLRLHLGRLHLLLGEYPAAAAHLAAALDLAAALPDPALGAAARDRLADLALARSDFPAALAQARANLAALDPADPATAPAHHILAFVAFRQADWPTARAHAAACLALRRAEGEPRFVAQSLFTLGQIEAEAGCPGAAVAVLAEAVACFTAAADPLSAAMTRVSLGLAHAYLGDHAAALACYAAAEPVFLRTGQPAWLARLCNNRGYTCEQQGDWAGAAAGYTASVGHARQAGDPLEIANGLDSLAGLYLRTGQPALARTALAEAQALLAQLPEPPGYLGGLIAAKVKALGEGGGA